MSKIKSSLFGVVLMSLFIAIAFGAIHQGLPALGFDTYKTEKAQSTVDNVGSNSGQIIKHKPVDSHKNQSITSSTQTEPIIEEKTDESDVAYIDLKPEPNWAVSSQVYIKGDDIKARSGPATDASIVAEYPYGTRLNVIGEKGDWYAIRDKADRYAYQSEYIKNREGLIDDKGQMIVYIQKKETGPIEELILNTQKLKKISRFSIGENHQSYESDKSLNEGYLTIEPISKALYDSRRISAVDFLKKQSLYVKDKEGVITISLPESSKKVVLKDHIVDDDGIEEYSYLGYIDGLNQHLVLGNYWESYDYTFYDMTSGKKTQSFTDYPHISPDQKFILTIYANPYEMTSDLGLYTVNDTDIKLVMSADFTHWMPTSDYRDIFWSTDGYLYLRVNHIAEAWVDSGNNNDTFQYIRIKVVL